MVTRGVHVAFFLAALHPELVLLPLNGTQPESVHAGTHLWYAWSIDAHGCGRACWHQFYRYHHGRISCMDGTTKYRCCLTTLDRHLRLFHARKQSGNLHLMLQLYPRRWTCRIREWNFTGPGKRGRPAYTWGTALLKYFTWKIFDNWIVEAGAYEHWTLIRIFLRCTINDRQKLYILFLAP